MTNEKDLGADAAAVVTAEQGSEKSAIARHTPTPWAFKGIESRHVVEIKTNVVVAYCGTVNRTLDEIDANAKFIVRACNSHDDLLAALKACVRSGHPSAVDHPTMYAAWEQAARAIAKAEGK